ncbi:hypothetical protein E1I18_02275 [Mycoplasmopsis mucosicanis]|uniref:BAX inhibitor (BI)-1/YccA family protein n=1 Tax=Mycoplasmopsis mucosicanis TaxID=458208 RepID=A0A507SHZ8_9BACT|nr:hypothetical protein [Mycoplasmopsis mucosicanis]TQC51489.1 hypothetical protein E1I18_02275 [Mycoplasmopsis mucosicanis]
MIRSGTFKESIKNSNKIVAGSIITFAIGIVIALAGGIVFASFASLFESFAQISIMWYVIANVVDFALILVILLAGPRMKSYILAPLVAISLFLLGFLDLGYVLVRFASEPFKIAGIFFIPAVAMIVIGALAAADKINITKVNILIAIIMPIFLIFVVVSFFVSNRNVIFTIISGFGFLLVILYMFIDWWFIFSFNKYYKSLDDENRTTELAARYSIYFGFKLTFDFVYAITYLASFLRK